MAENKGVSGKEIIYEREMEEAVEREGETHRGEGERETHRGERERRRGERGRPECREREMP